MEFADVGCGFGGLTVRLAEAYPDKLVLGMELRDKVSGEEQRQDGPGLCLAEACPKRASEGAHHYHCSCGLSTVGCTHPGFTHPTSLCRVCQGAHHRPAQAAPRPVPERQRGACACCGLPVGAAGPCVPSPAAAAAAASCSCQGASAHLNRTTRNPLTQRVRVCCHPAAACRCAPMP